jgi:purine-binding chemotaxis protein CheW
MDRPAPPAEVISVSVREQLFALDIMCVREIRGWTASTTVPHSPAHVLGMINLRGAVLPVLDLAGLLGLPQRAPDASSVVVVAELGDNAFGLLVDAVCDILTVRAEDVQQAPTVGAASARVVRGMIPMGDTIVTLLDLSEDLAQAA